MSTIGVVNFIIISLSNWSIYKSFFSKRESGRSSEHLTHFLTHLSLHLHYIIKMNLFHFIIFNFYFTSCQYQTKKEKGSILLDVMGTHLPNLSGIITDHNLSHDNSLLKRISMWVVEFYMLLINTIKTINTSKKQDTIIHSTQELRWVFEYYFFFFKFCTKTL